MGRGVPWRCIGATKGPFLLPAQSWACRNATKQRKTLSFGHGVLLCVLQSVWFSWYALPWSAWAGGGCRGRCLPRGSGIKLLRFTWGPGASGRDWFDQPEGKRSLMGTLQWQNPFWPENNIGHGLGEREGRRMGTAELSWAPALLRGGPCLARAWVGRASWPGEQRPARDGADWFFIFLYWGQILKSFLIGLFILRQITLFKICRQRVYRNLLNFVDVCYVSWKEKCPATPKGHIGQRGKRRPRALFVSGTHSHLQAGLCAHPRADGLGGGEWAWAWELVAVSVLASVTRGVCEVPGRLCSGLSTCETRMLWMLAAVIQEALKSYWGLGGTLWGSAPLYEVGEMWLIVVGGERQGGRARFQVPVVMLVFPRVISC